MSEPSIPQSFRDQPRWWSDGTDWLDSLPGRIARQCEVWNLRPDGRPWHGSNALVLPVLRDCEPYALRLAPPDERTRTELAALDFWAGRGTVLQHASDPDAGASLLERLDGDVTLRGIDLDPAAEILGEIIRRLAVPIGDQPRDQAVPGTAKIIADTLAQLEQDWDACGRPFDRSVLAAATSAAEALVGIDDDVAVNGDLHHDQVLRGGREPWLVVDPVLLRGDIAYDLARCLWWRLDDMRDDQVIRNQLTRIARWAGIDHDHAVAAVTFRAVGYWLWGLQHGLTEDPVRCARLVSAVL